MSSQLSLRQTTAARIHLAPPATPLELLDDLERTHLQPSLFEFQSPENLLSSTKQSGSRYELAYEAKSNNIRLIQWACHNEDTRDHKVPHG